MLISSLQLLIGDYCISLISLFSLIDGFCSVIMHFRCKLSMGKTMLTQTANIRYKDVIKHLTACVLWSHVCFDKFRFTHLYLLYLFQGTEMFNFAHYRNIHFKIPCSIFKISQFIIYKLNHQISFILHLLLISYICIIIMTVDPILILGEKCCQIMESYLWNKYIIKYWRSNEIAIYVFFITIAITKFWAEIKLLSLFRYIKIVIPPNI